MSVIAPITWTRSRARWLVITGLIELLTAVGLAAAGWFVPVGRLGLWLTAGLLGLVGLGLLGWGRGT